jgi:hypothetical protein
MWKGEKAKPDVAKAAKFANAAARKSARRAACLRVNQVKEKNQKMVVQGRGLKSRREGDRKVRGL